MKKLLIITLIVILLTSSTVGLIWIEWKNTKTASQEVASPEVLSATDANSESKETAAPVSVQAPISAPVSTSSSVALENQGPHNTVLAFYQDYVSCMKKPPDGISTTSAEYCQTHNSYATGDLAKNVKNDTLTKLGFDPVICTQTPPKEIQIGLTLPPENSNVTVSVATVLKNGMNINIKAITIKDKDQWKVNNISCPK